LLVIRFGVVVAKLAIEIELWDIINEKKDKMAKKT